jgi:integrase
MNMKSLSCPEWDPLGFSYGGGGGSAAAAARLRGAARGRAPTSCRRSPRQVPNRRLGSADDILDADGRDVLSWAQAQRQAHDWFIRRDAEETGERQIAADKLTIGDALDADLDWYKVNRKAYVETKHNVEAHIRPALGAIEIRRLTALRIERWKAALAAAPPRLRTRKGAAQVYGAVSLDGDRLRARKVTANRNLTILKAALNKLHRERRLAALPVWREVARFGNVDAARPRFLEHAEAVRLINACEPTFRPLVQGALVTGARYGELARLRVDDYRGGKLQIRDNKSGKARWVGLAAEGGASSTSSRSAAAARSRCS